MFTQLVCLALWAYLFSFFFAPQPSRALACLMLMRCLHLDLKNAISYHFFLLVQYWAFAYLTTISCTSWVVQLQVAKILPVDGMIISQYWANRWYGTLSKLSCVWQIGLCLVSDPPAVVSVQLCRPNQAVVHCLLHHGDLPSVYSVLEAW